MSSSILSFFVTANPPKRLDKALSRDAPVSASLSRSRLRKLIEQGVVRVDGSVATHIDAPVSEGQLVEIMIPEIKDIDNEVDAALEKVPIPGGLKAMAFIANPGMGMALAAHHAAGKVSPESVENFSKEYGFYDLKISRFPIGKLATWATKKAAAQ